MKLAKLILILQALHLCQAYNNSSAQTGKNASQSELDNNQTEPYITQRSNACSWSPMIFRDEIWTSVTFTAESRDQVAHQICMALGCGGVYSLNETSAPPNSICLTNCTYREYRLQNCSHVVRMNCTKVSDVVCGHQAVRLAGGEHRCAGRVELWREGQQWGTVCDDEWDMRDADVVCAQLGCGYAISVTGQGGAFPQGKDPIYLDELKCTGKEGNLWQCPASDKRHDCGHKEDAGVVCSELKAVRLTGGVDHCSGKVEIHRNGSWGTVCDNCWGKEEASMVCSMLGCGEPVHFVAFKPPFTHNNGTLWYYRCDPHHTDLWQCKEFANITILCTDSEAAGLICSGSRGRYLPVTTEAAATVLSRTPGEKVTTTSVANYGFPFAMSLELLGCISLSFLLLTALVTNALLCCHYRRRNALLVQQRHANLQTPTEHHDKDYRDSVNLIKVTTSSPTENEVPANPRYQWTQSSVDSTSVDTDYEQCDLNAEAAVHMTTFQNSIRYKQDTRNPFMRATALDSLSEEGDNHNVFIGGICDQAPGCNIGPPSVDSFDSSSTSSEECYENTGKDVENLLTSERMDPWQPPVTHNANNHLMPSGNPDQTQSHDQGVADGKSDEYEEEGHLYSPDPNQSSSEGVYDDIANYLDSNPEQGY